MGDLERLGYDLLVNAGGSPPPREDVILVDFDDASVAALHTYPVSRGLVAKTLGKISEGNPELIGLDMLLSEKRTPEEDRELGAALRDAGNVILASQLGSGQLPLANPLPEFCQPESDPRNLSYCQPGGAFGYASINMPVDDDGFIRRMYLLPAKDASMLSFPVALARDFRRQALQPAGPGFALFDGHLIPLDDSGDNTALIGAWSVKPVRIVSALNVLAPGFDPAVFKGKLVLIGQSNAAGGDRHFTPVFRPRQQDGSRVMLSGAEIHAAAIATLLDGRAIRVIDQRTLWAANFLAGLLLLVLIIVLRPVYSVPLMLAAMMGAYAAAQHLFSSHQAWMKFGTTEATLLLALPAGLGYRFVQERWLKSQAEAERRQLMGIFSRYVSPEVATEIWERRREIVLGGQEKTATVLFSDIRNFTALTAGKPSAEVLGWLNDYFTAMADVIREQGGFLNKFIGDGIMAVYGVPLSNGAQDDACRAVETALRMIARVEALNREHEGDPRYPRIRIGVGVHTGPLTAGNVGSRDRMEYSVIGETVNLASRLESLCKDFKTDIVLSPETFALIQERFATRPLAETAVRGFGGKIQVYTVVRISPVSGDTPPEQ
jgi:adenylate cyclase